MRGKVLLVALAVILSSVAVAPAATATPPAGYTRLYADEFNGTALNTTDWYHRITGPYGPVNGYVTAANVSESAGTLKLKYSSQDVTGDGVPEYVGGGVISRRLFGYGYYETRAKLFNATTGLHTSFWGMGVNRNMGGAGGDPGINSDIDNALFPEYNQLYEIDGVEHDSASGLDTGTNVYTAGTANQRMGAKNAAQLGIDFAGWNVYGYEYTPTAIKFYINDNLVFTTDLTTHPYSFNPMNVWLTALPYSSNNNPALLPGTAEFDYFHYYAKPQPGVSLLANSAFDTRPTTASYPGYSVVPGWIENFDKAASTIEDTDVHDGTRALRQSSTTSFVVTDKQNLTAIPNGTYTLTAWVKSSGGLSSAVMRVLNHGSAELDANIPATSTWTQLTIPNIPVTSNAATIAFSSTGAANQWVQIDGVKFSQN
jgi:beta-glucanase (GH16 family)